MSKKSVDESEQRSREGAWAPRGLKKMLAFFKKPYEEDVHDT